MLPIGTLRRSGLFFAVGSLIGTLFDRIHVATGVLQYPRPVLAGQGWWVPFLMGGAGVALVSGRMPLLRRLGDRRNDPSEGLVVSIVWFGAAYLASGLFQSNPLTLASALSMAFVVRAAVYKLPAREWLLAVATGVTGTLFEAVLCALGSFSYVHPDALRVPAWLPALYLHAALLARAIDRRVALGNRGTVGSPTSNAPAA
jgi:hypothetical protein